MISRNEQRALIVWMLLGCILINALVCSLNHASHVGFELALGQAAFCLSDDGGAASAFPGAAHGASEMPFECALCASAFLAVVILLGLGWLRRSVAAPHRPRRCAERLAPRYCRPSLNPRASP